MASINWSAVNAPTDLLQAANTTTSGYFWTAILYMAVIILTLSMINIAGFEAALMVSLFIGIILGVMLLYMGLIGFQWLAILVGIELFIIIYLTVTSGRNN